MVSVLVGVGVQQLDNERTVKSKHMQKNKNKINYILFNKNNKNISILLAEDVDLNIRIAKAILNKLGYYNIDYAKDGVKALEMVDKKKYDVILLDIKMPKLDGIKVFEKIKDKYINRPYIIALTANNLDVKNQHYIDDIGMDNYISKPIDINKLKKILESI